MRLCALALALLCWPARAGAADGGPVDGGVPADGSPADAAAPDAPTRPDAGAPDAGEPDVSALEQAAAVAAGAETIVVSAADDVDEEVIVRARRVRSEAGRTGVRVEEARRVPGTQGDAAKVVQSLPGVARPAFGGDKLVVWGAAPRDTRVYVDGVEIPALYHLGGVRSVLPADLVRSLELVPGGFGVEHGRSLGGVVRLETRELPEGLHGFVAADLLDASAMVTASPLPRLRLAVSGRYGWLDRILLGAIRDVGDFVPIPRYDDEQVKVTLALRDDEELGLLFLATHDKLRRAVASPDPAETRAEDTVTSAYRFILRYARIFPDGASVTVSPSVGWDRATSATSFGAVPTYTDADSVRYGVRAVWRQRLAPRLTATAGMDFQGSHTQNGRYGSLTLPPREGDPYVFGQPPGAEIANDDWTTEIVDAAPFAGAELALGPLTLAPGLRVDAFLIEGDRLLPRVGLAPATGFSRLEWSADPRLSAVLRVAPGVSVSGSAGLYHQPPAAEDLSATFGSPALRLERGWQATLGAAAALGAVATVEATGFWKSLADLVVRSRAPSPALAHALVQTGEGHGYGVQLLVRRELARGLFGWIAYTFSRAERKDEADPLYRLFDHDQPHVLAAVASWEVGGWAFGGRARYASGAPRTPVDGAFYDARDDRYEPIMGLQNSIRIPAFFQLDLRIDRRFAVGALRIDLYLDVQNVTNRDNAEEIVYDRTYRQRGHVTGLPTLAVLGARVEL